MRPGGGVGFEKRSSSEAALDELIEEEAREARVIVADDSIDRLRVLMALPTLESIFSQLAVEQDTAAISRQIVDLVVA